MKQFTALILTLCTVAALSCGCNNRDGVNAGSDGSVTSGAENDFVIFDGTDEDKTVNLVYNVDSSSYYVKRMILGIRDALQAYGGRNVKPTDDFVPADENVIEIIVNSDRRQASAELKLTLPKNGYIIKAVEKDGFKSLVIVYDTVLAGKCAVGRFIHEYIVPSDGSNSFSVPSDLDIRGTVDPTDVIIESTIANLRDPCVLFTGGKYYVYGTGYDCYWADSLDSENFTGPVKVVRFPDGHECDGNQWAPEVYEYNGSFYMFTTYHSSKTLHRGCTVLKSDSPLGPFTEISNGQITPHDWDSIDATLYLDTDGTPWMIFVHEWTSTSDGVGRMAAAQLSDDLTHFITEPVELFRGDSPAWKKDKITDGCWLYRTEAGTLLMLWSNSNAEGYSVGIARSETGSVTGPWTQDATQLYSKSVTGIYDGGHGMIFKDAAGHMYLSLHSPNKATATRKEIPVFIRIYEDTLFDTLDIMVYDYQNNSPLGK